MSTSTNLRSILVGVDGSEFSQCAIEFAVQWCKQYGCHVVGIDAVNEESHRVVAFEGGAGVAAEVTEREISAARERVRRSLDTFETQCQQADVKYARCEESGNAVDRILIEAQRADLIVLGRETHFYSEWLADSTLALVLRNASRPVVVVPQSPSSNRDILVAYDGSRPASQALFAFVQLGLAQGRNLHILSATPGAEESESIAQPACDFLSLHNIHSQIHAFPSDGAMAKIILSLIDELDVGLLVAGAYGKSRMRELILGSTTKRLTEESHVPIFMYH